MSPVACNSHHTSIEGHASAVKVIDYDGSNADAWKWSDVQWQLQRAIPASLEQNRYRPMLSTLLLATSAACFGANSLPEPLSYSVALDTAHNLNHYQLESLEQRLLALQAELGIRQADQGISLDLTGRVRNAEPSDFAPDTSANDSATSLILSKPIYDFGLQNSRERALAMQLEALEIQKDMLIEQRRLEIMARYFAVLDADNQFISENEALAIGFIRFDNAREDFELGLVAELDVLQRQSEYEVIRQKRYFAAQQQRLARARLAEIMGYPAQLPTELESPMIETSRPLPENPDFLVERALVHSLEARVAAANTRAAQAGIAIADASDNPSLDFEFEISHYQREGRFRDDWRASLYFEFPLYASATPARVNQARALYRQALADQQRAHSQLRLEVLELWQQIQQQRLIVEGAIIEQEYRDRYLDRSRAEYELEFKTDLGDSMVLYSRSSAALQKALYDFEIAYQRLLALVGKGFLESR